MMKDPVIVNVPEKMQKFYGTAKMLHPSIEMIEEAVKIIPIGKVATIESLCIKLSDDFGTDVTCPMRTGNGIKKITETLFSTDIDHTIPVWRVIRSNSLMINSKHVEQCATKLEKEGVGFSFTKKGEIKVDAGPEILYSF
ncbi:hypothetical protein FNH22_01160 [Fulvivirga sp. M361]|uniref:MGMT family protein n=1 Tax=Fulvivirga sp. M361 TaxID=2594266 RepID=UPI00117B9DB8|nr:MGMT family protein [Fulvivirga sp. M361]TRX62735.1 hypothetical protein FNH22_01160 [Fulvivirga sp. M361]